MRDDVKEKMLSGENAGSVRRTKLLATTKRMRRARETFGGTGRIETPWTLGAARTER
jgi:secreted trypsin-like serine protease